MGNTGSGGMSVAGGNAYAALQQQVGGGVLGGAAFAVGGGFFGGAADEDPTKDLRAYRESLASATKERLFRGLARALVAVGVRDVDPETSPPREILAALEKQLPNPRKNGKNFSSEAKAQAKFCKAVADALNNEFTPGAAKSRRLIDTSLGDESVCRQVSELVYSMATGLQTEFLEVHASLKRVVRNLEILDEVLTELHGKASALVKDDDLAAGDDKKFQAYQEVYERAQAERLRQMGVLKNFLNVTLAPAKEELAVAMRETGESHDLIRKLKLVPGTSDFATHLAEAVSGLGTVAAMSSRVDKALKEVGMGVEDYLRSSDISALSAKIDDLMMSDSRKGDLGKFLKQAQTLKENFYRRDELELGGEHGSVHGGAVSGGSKLDKRVKKRREERRLLVQEFINRSTRSYDALLKAIQDLGPKLGKEIPIGEKMRALRDSVTRMGNAQIGAEKLALELIGFLDTASARKNKERFLMGLRDVRNAVDDVMASAAYQSSSRYFAPMREAIASLIKTIDFFSDTFAKKYGAGEGDATDAADAAGGADEGVAGGADDDLADLPRVARSGYDLTRSVNAFRYYFYTAEIRANLKKTQKELDHYGEKYQDVLGDAVAARLKKLDKEESGDDAASTMAKLKLIKAAAAPYAGATPAQKNAADAAIEKLKGQYKCKRKFYKSLQALDLYLKAFTDGIVANPDDAIDIKRMLDGTEVIGRWFTENTGNHLARAFDRMPGYHGAAQHDVPRAVDQPAAGGPLNANSHYYARVAAGADIAANNAAANAAVGGGKAGLLVGIPQLARSAGDDAAKKASDDVAAVFDYFQALKNLVTAFAHIGSKFGGKDLNRQVFQSPTQIFRTLQEYLKCSAMSINPAGDQTVSIYDANAAAAAAAPANLIGKGAAAAAAGNNLPVAAGAAFELDNVASVYFSGRPNAQTNFATEDRYFSYIVKAMAAKILTVLGVSDMFSRPSPVYDLTPTRIIIGGAEYEEIPEANPAASELYFRLPRLAEFYRTILGMDATDNGAAKQISLLPEVEGVFSGLVRLVFLRANDSYETGSYSDYEMRTMVREINSIHKHYESEGEGACSAALSAFIAEINRRYGVVKKEEWTKLRGLLTETQESMGARGDLNPTDYSILPGEDEYQVERRAPSDRYLGADSASKNDRESKYEIDQGDDPAWGQWDMLKTFRAKIDKAFEGVSPDQFTTLSYSGIIKQAAREMGRAGSTTEKFRVASQLIQGSGNLAGADVSKSLMFHETVITGLNVLTAIQRMLVQVRTAIFSCDIVTARKAIRARFDDETAAFAANQANIRALATIANNGGAAAAAGMGGAVERRGLDFIHAGGDSLGGRCGHANGDNQTYAAVYTAAASVHTLAVAAAAGGNAYVDASAERRVTSMTRDFLAAYAIDCEGAMRRLLSVVMSLASKKELVEVRFPNTAASQLILDFSGVSNLAQGLMSDVRFYLDKFRPFVSKAVFDRYEGGDNAGEGSYAWLEENLMDEFIVGKAGYRTAAADQRFTLDKVARTANEIFVDLTKKNDRTLVQFVVGGAGPDVNTGANPGGANAAGGAGNLGAGNLVARVNAALIAPPPGNPEFGHEQYGHVLSGLIFWDATASDSSGLPGGGFVELATRDGAGAAVLPVSAPTYIESLISAERPRAVRQGNVVLRAFYQVGAGAAMRALPARARPGPNANANFLGRAPDGTANARLDNIWSAGAGGGIGGARSRLMMFNQLLALYLRTFVDATTGKIYRGLIEGFASGSLSQSIMSSGLAIPDLVRMFNFPGAAAAPFGRRGDPMPGSLVLQSLATILQRLMVDSNPTTQISDHLISTLSEVPQYLLEGYRANLPQYTKMFQAVRRECEFLKKVIASTPIQVGRPNAFVGAAGGVLIALNNGGAGATAANPQGYPAGSLVLSTRVLGDNQNLSLRLQGILDGIASAAYAVGNAAGSVVRELADDAKYLQVQSNSIQDYKARYDKLPLMPLSLMTTYLRDANQAPSRLPIAVAGSTQFKLMYGTRKLLGTESTYSPDDAPGASALLEAFNASAAEREKMDASRFASFASKSVGGLQILEWARNCAGETAPAQAQLYLIADPNIPQAIRTYSVRTTPEATVNVVEASDQSSSIRLITDNLGSAPGATGSLGGKRSTERIANIIDMNAMPINVHALMRTMPLAPTYNYAYSFEQEIALMYGESLDRKFSMGALGAGETAPFNTRQAFIAMMCNPYGEVTDDMYGKSPLLGGASGFIHRIFRGDTSLLMGRPKFLSDQVFNKALFGSLVPSTQSQDETGPPGAGRMAAANAEARGRAAAAGRSLVAGPAWLAQPGAAQNAVNLAAARAALAAAPGRPGAAAGPAWDLTYLRGPDEATDPGAVPTENYQNSVLVPVPLGADPGVKRAQLDAVGKARFDTRIVRNLFFISNVQRALRLKMNQELTQYRNVLVSGHAAVNPGVTEYGNIAAGNISGTRRARAIYAANEVAGSRQYESDARFNQ